MKHKRIWRLRIDVEGVGTIEFAFATSLLCTLVLGTLDFGLGLFYQMQVNDAARAGAAYALINGWNQTAIQTAVTSATGLASITASPVPTKTCGCPNVSSGITAATCGSTCTSGNAAGTYVTVHAQASYSLIVPWPGISSPMTLAAATTVKISN